MSLHLLESLENILLFLTREQVRNTLYIIAGLVFLRAFYSELKPCVSGSSFPLLMMIAVCASDWISDKWQIVFNFIWAIYICGPGAARLLVIMNYVFLWLTPPNLGDNQLIGDTRHTSSLSGGDNIDLQLDKLWPRQTSIVEKSCIVKSKRKVLSSQKSITLWIHSILCNRVLLPV